MTASLIHQMYIAYYQRPADPAGLAYWQAQLTANGGGEAGWNAVAAAFANAAESSALYGSQTLSQKISAIYLAAFERAAVESEVTFWASSGFTEAQIAFAIVNGAQNDDLNTVTNKETYAVNFVATLDPAGTGVGPFAYEYTDASIGRTLMGAITKDSDTSTTTVASQVSANVPTLVTVSLTSGADTITPTTNAVENISAALGGSSPNLGRTDQIDGGSANDIMTISTDGNFLLGFSTGYIKNVETLNFNTTSTSVTTKLVNLTGVSGVETFNVGASMANVKLSEVSDVGQTINVSGLSSGTFEVQFAANAISASGSAMTLGVSDIGSTGAAVSMITQGVTDLTIVAGGSNNTESFVNLSNTNNTYQTISVIGSSDLNISDVGSAASAILASSFAGDLTIGLDLDTNEKMGASGEVITGGAGFDTLSLKGSAQIKASTSSIEELLFDGSEAEVNIKASGMIGIQTLTFSGQNATNSIAINGLDATSRTINSILEAASPVTQSYSAGGDLTVNLNVDPSWIIAETKRDNDFVLTAKNSGSVTLNVGAYTSSAGTHTLSNATGVVVNVDTTGHFGGTVKADKATTISVEGGANIDATVSGLAATTFSFNVGSGTIAYGGTAVTTVQLTNAGTVTVTAATRTSSVETLTIDTGALADFALIGTTALTTLQISGAGTVAAAKIGTHSGVSNDLTMSLTGLAAGFSAGNVTKISSDLTVAGAASDGFLWFNAITASGLVVTTGTTQNFHADAINVEKFTFDGAAATSTTNSASIGLGFVTASSTITISLGQGSGIVSAAGLNTLGAVTLDGSNFEGSVNIPNISGSGVTISMGVNGFFSASSIQSNKAFTLDGSDAASSQVSLGLVEASTDLTISLGSGSGSLTVSGSNPGLSAGGALVIDGSKGAANMHVFSVTASGATISLGTTGYFSSTDVQIGEGAFTLDGAVATSATIIAQSISSSAALTISLGSGSGQVAVTGIDTQAAFTLDGSNSKATIDLQSISASGMSIVTGAQGDFSANAIVSDSNMVIDASNAATASISMRNSSVSGSITISLGSGVGSLGASGIHANKGITIDATKFGGSMDLGGISGSGVTISLGTAGNLSASSIATTTTFTMDGAAAASSNATLSQLDVSANAALTLGSGAGAFTIGSASANGTFTLDGSNSNAAISIGRLSASGSISLVTGVNGTLSAGETIITGVGGFTLDASNATSIAIGLGKVVSVGNVDSTISVGSGAGAFSAGVLAGDAAFTIDASKSSAAFDIASISASGITVTLGGAGNLSSNIISSGKLFTLDGSGMASSDIDLKGISASGGISITLAGSATMSSLEANSLGNFTLTAAGAAEDIDITNISASGVSITTGIQGDFSASSIAASDTVTIDASGSTTAQGINIGRISASGAVTITMGAGSGIVSAATVGSLAGFTLNASRFDGEIDIRDISASGATVTLGTGGDFSASVISMMAGTFTLNATSSDASGELIAITHVSASAVTMNMNSKAAVSANIASAQIAADFTFNGANYNGGLDITDLSASGVTITTGAAFNYSAQSSQVLGNFTLNGGALTSANITLNTFSASGSVNMQFGAMSGDLVVSAMSVGGSVTWSAENAAGMGVRIGNMSAESAFTVTLGEVSDTSNNFSASIIAADTFTINGALYRESINLHAVSASAVSITVGDLTDDLFISSLQTTNFTLDGGDGSNFSAIITSANISGSAWSITMGELGNGLAIGDVTFASSWTIVGTQGIDSISASAANTAATNLRKIDIDFRDDSAADLAGIAGSAGKTYVIMRNFDAGEDKIGLAVSASTALAISKDIGAAYINDVLGTTLTSADVVSAGTALFTYNSDTYFIGAEDKGTTLGNGDYVVRFVGVTDIVNNTDIDHMTAD
jgi:S-layer protein